MRVIIVGASKIGYALVKQISKEDVDIVVIDKQEKVIDEITDAFDCNGFVGNGCSVALLKKAGIDSASLFVSLTKSDETNILCCSIAKKLGVKRTVAAVRYPEFKGDKAFLSTEMGVDDYINPDKAAAHEVSKIIRYSREVEIERFGRDDVAIATAKISSDNILVGSLPTQISEKLGVKALICAVNRNGKILYKNSIGSIKEGDMITFVASGSNMDTVLCKLNVLEKVVKNVVIIGAGRIGCYLIRMFERQGVKVTVIDNSFEKCKQLQEEYENVQIICGDGTDTSLIEKVLKGKDALAIMTGQDEENLIISMYAKSMGLEHIVAEIDNISFDTMLKKSGINHTFSTQNVAIGAIIRDMRLLVADEDENDNNVIKWVYNLNDEKVEAAMFELTEDFKKVDIPIGGSKFSVKAGVVIAAIVRDKEVIIPDENSVLHVHDKVIIVSCEHKISKLTDIFA